jgi:threonine/homoserine/homoserine lactone efflux protein
MLSFAFFILAVIAGAAGLLLLPPGVQQIGAWAVGVLFLALAAFSMIRKTNRPWR